MENDLDMALCEMTKQRDDLLEALKDMVDYFKYTAESEGQEEAAIRAKEAIEKAELSK